LKKEADIRAYPGERLRKCVRKGKWRTWSPGNTTRSVLVKTDRGKIQVVEFRTSCMDCKREDPTFFMVTDEVWREAGFKECDDGIICIFCLKKRLGRSFDFGDFTLNKMNDVVNAVFGCTYLKADGTPE
jgi:hypothetical protein